MRCPKCGFTSFDHLETCKKCHKNLGDTVAEVKGTAYDVTPPLFLTVMAAKEEAAPLAAQQTEEQGTAPESANQIIFAMEEVGEETSTPEPEEPQEAERREIEFAGFDDEMEIQEEAVAETPAKAEFIPAEEQAAEEPPPAMPAMDFRELDISDLAPPATEQAAPTRSEKPPEALELEPVAALSAAPQASAGKHPAAGLEDLNTSGLDLDIPTKPISGSAVGKRFLPSVKTGTALDKFDVDLGELLADIKKEKMLQ